MLDNHQISVIVPVYNEEKNAANVLQTLTNIPFLDEVICINDASTDRTLIEISKIKNIQVINLPKNGGKAKAIAQGILASQGEIVVFVDGDLKGVTESTIQRLIQPLITESYVASVGFPTHRKIADVIFKPLGGERAYYRSSLLPLIKDFDNLGYGLELFLNHAFSNQKVKPVPLDEIYQPLKNEKQDFKTVMRQMTIQTYQLTREFLRHRNPIQFFNQAYLKHFFYSTN